MEKSRHGNMKRAVTKNMLSSSFFLKLVLLQLYVLQEVITLVNPIFIKLNRTFFSSIYSSSLWFVKRIQ